MVRRLVVLYHGDFKEHSPGSVKHPEGPGRLDVALRSVADIVSSAPRGRVAVRGAPRGGSLDVFKVVHDQAYVEHVKSILRSRRFEWLDRDTYVSRGTVKALLRLVGASQKAVALALRGVNSFILGRPPSHHAGVSGRAMSAPSMGFCLLNATALIARVLAAHGRVAIVDFDVHHGNGTQEIFYDDPYILHVDIHVDPMTSYPGTGHPMDVGRGAGAGTKVNIVTPHMAGDDIYGDALGLVKVVLGSWKPEYIVVSAGFDAYRGDNEMVLMNVGTRFYYNIGRLLASKAKAVVSILEGGYGIGLDRALKAYIAGILGLRTWPWDPPSYSDGVAWRSYRAYKRLTIAGILKHAKISLPKEIARKVETLRPRMRRYRRKRRYRRYI
jgi:Deacetylases, including yeast histone deacetylase and acetoin utilization protein